MDYLGFLNLYQGGSKEYLLASVLGGVPIWDQDVPLLVHSKKKKFCQMIDIVRINISKECSVSSQIKIGWQSEPWAPSQFNISSPLR